GRPRHGEVERAGVDGDAAGEGVHRVEHKRAGAGLDDADAALGVAGGPGVAVRRGGAFVVGDRGCDRLDRAEIVEHQRGEAALQVDAGAEGLAAIEAASGLDSPVVDGGAGAFDGQRCAGLHEDVAARAEAAAARVWAAAAGAEAAAAKAARRAVASGRGITTAAAKAAGTATAAADRSAAAAAAKAARR